MDKRLIEFLIDRGYSDNYIVKRILEMPHIYLDGDPFDVEMEAHIRDFDELLTYFYDVLTGETFDYKYGKNVTLNMKQRKELATFLTTNEMIQLVLVKQYGEQYYAEFVDMIDSLRLI